jgi:hypothetical protein
MPARKTLDEYNNSVFTLKLPIFLGFLVVYVYIVYP